MSQIRQQQRSRTLTIGRGILAILAIMFVVLGLISFNEYKLDRTRILESLSVELHDTVERIDRRFLQMEDRLDATAKWATIQYMQYDPAAVNPSLLRKITLDPSGEYYEIPPPQSDDDEICGNLVGIAGNQNDPEFLKEADVTCRMFNLLYPLYEGDTQLSGSHYISSSQGFMLAYPYRPAIKLLPQLSPHHSNENHHLHLHELMLQGSLGSDPIWSEPWPTEGTHGLAIYRFNPIHVDGTLIGTLESEVKLGFIEKLLPSKLLPKSQVLIIDDKSRIIASTDNTNLPEGEISDLNKLLDTDNASEISARLLNTNQLVKFKTPDYTVQLEQLTSTPWYIVNLVPDTALSEFLRPQIENYLMQIALLALLLTLAYITIHMLFVRPFAQAEEELERSHAQLEQRVMERTQELESLYEELQATNEELTASNEELTASNEELAATNEELNAANEEIIATNEELEGAYQQLNSLVQQLRESEDRLRAIFLRSAVPSAVADPEYNIVEANDAFCKWLGYEQEELPALNFFNLTHPDEKVETEENRQRLLSENTNEYFVEKRYQHKNGEYLWADVSAACVRDEDGALIYLIVQAQDKTARKAAEEALRESNERFYTAFNSSPDAIGITHVETGEYIEVNEGFINQTGYSSEEVIGKTSIELGIWENEEDRTKCISLLSETGKVHNLEFAFKSKHGKHFDGLISAQIIYLKGERYLLSIVRDITQLRSTERQLQRFFSLTASLMLIGDVEGNIIQVNNHWEELLGYTLDEIVGHNFVEFVHPDDIQRTLEKTRNDALESAVGQFENRFVSKDGSIHYLLWSAAFSLEEKLVFAIAHDMTELQMAHKALEESEDQFRAYFELGLVPMAIITPEGQWLQVNHRLCELAGYSTEELLKRNLCDMLPERYSESVKLNLDSLVNNEQDSFSIELPFIPRNNADCIINLAARARRDDKGNVVYILAQLQDITAARRAESELRKLTTAIHQASEMIAITDPRGRIIYVNPAFSKLTGYGEREVLGKHIRLLRSPQHDESFYSQLWETASSGEPWQGELTINTKGDHLYYTEASVTPVHDENQQIINIVAIARDVTQQRRWEQQVRQSQKMEAIGTLAGGIAHDFNNILFAMLGNTEIALEGLPDNSGAHGCLKEVQLAGERAKELIKQILSFARQSDQELGPVQLGAIIKEVAKLMRASLPATIEIRLQLNYPDAVVLADATQIHQIVMNLCTNAGQAMTSTGGMLTLRLECFELKQDQHPELALSPGKYARLDITDTGPGITAEVLPRVFEPFFTTKEKGKGTGMGLAVVHGVVAELGGEIVASSTPGEGATFSVLLPIAERYMVSPLQMDGSLPRGQERIMLVDDESTLVSMLKDIFISLGYKVDGYEHSLEALEAFTSTPDDYDLVFTDQTMPKLTGTELAKRCRAIRPDIPVILCTGYSQLALEDELASGVINEFVTKPLSRQSIAQVIRRVLDQKNPAQAEAANG